VSFDLPTLAVIWGLCGVVYGAWMIQFLFHGGEKSMFYQSLHKIPGASGMSPRALYVLALFSVLPAVVVWPLYIIFWFIGERRRRRTVLYLHPKLGALCSRMAGRESEYQMIFPEFQLDGILTALHALDLDAIDGELTYTDIVTAAVAFVEFKSLQATLRNANEKRAVEISESMKGRFSPSIREPSMCIGTLIIGYVHGWMRAEHLDEIKQIYTRNLKAEYANADHVFAVFQPIAAKTEDEINIVVPKGADMIRDGQAAADPPTGTDDAPGSEQPPADNTSEETKTTTNAPE
jgi:hypothetical protein